MGEDLPNGNLDISPPAQDADLFRSNDNDLAEGGKIKMPLAEQSPGTAVGWLTDKFGINWMVSIDKA